MRRLLPIRGSIVPTHYLFRTNGSIIGGDPIGEGDLDDWMRAARATPRPDEEADDESAKLELGELAIEIGESAAARRWRASDSVVQLKKQIDNKAPNRNRRDDGTIGDERHASRASDHNPWIIDGAFGVVSAIDITHDPDNGCDNNLIVNALVTNHDPRLKYIIWNRRICNSVTVGGASSWTWRPYEGRNSHAAHFHLSVKSAKELYDSKDVWNLKPWA